MWASLSGSEQRRFEMPLRATSSAVELRLAAAFNAEQPSSAEVSGNSSRALVPIRGLGMARGTQEIEDQIFTVLMEAIIRAERNARVEAGAAVETAGPDAVPDTLFSEE